MTREDYEAHKEDYKDNNVSSSAFVLIQDVYIRILEAQMKAKDEEIYKYQMAIDKQSKRAEELKQLSLYKDKEIERLKEFEEMVEWMELNSNRSLCDYYNNKDNKWQEMK